METPYVSRFSPIRALENPISNQALPTRRESKSLLSNMVCALRGHLVEQESELGLRQSPPKTGDCELGANCLRCGDQVARRGLHHAARSHFAA